MLLDDAMCEPFVELGPSVDRDGVSTGCTDGVHYVRVGELHHKDFSKAF
jgi:hypothetical protein